MNRPLISFVWIVLLIGRTPFTFAQLAEMPPIAGHDTASAPELPGTESSADRAAGLSDHAAKVFNVTGSAKILKKGSDNWLGLANNTVLEAGDEIFTGKDGVVEIVYDDYFLNVAVLKQNTKASFRSIEPTILDLQDGSVLSNLDGLKGDPYSIATPTAVASVRGTVLAVEFEAATSSLNILSFVPPGEEKGDADGVVHDVMITPANPKEGTSEITLHEGSQLSLHAEQDFSQAVIRDIPSGTPAEIDHYLSDLRSAHADERKKGQDEMAAAELNDIEQKANDQDRDKAGPHDGGNGGDSHGNEPPQHRDPSSMGRSIESPLSIETPDRKAPVRLGVLEPARPEPSAPMPPSERPRPDEMVSPPELDPRSFMPESPVDPRTIAEQQQDQQAIEPPPQPIEDGHSS